MNLMARRRALMAASHLRLPAEYQEVEWVGVQNHSSSPTAYIDVGVYAIPTGAVLRMETKPFSIIGQYDSPAGYNGSFEIYYTNNGQAMATYGGTTYNFTYTIGSEWDSFSITSGRPSGLNLLTYRADKYAFNGKFKTAQITDSSNNVVHDYVPCYRKSDNEIGVYDIVTDTFHTNSGTGTLVKGNDV